MTSTPIIGHEPITMHLIKNPHCLDSDNLFKFVGDFWWRVIAGQRTLVVAIPSENMDGWVLSQFTIEHENICGASWSWDGNIKQPTLKPSLHACGIWHGFCKNGQLVEAT